MRKNLVFRVMVLLVLVVWLVLLCGWWGVLRGGGLCEGIVELRGWFGFY